MVTVKAPDPSTKAVDRFPPVGIRQEALAAMAARVAGKEKSDSRARMAVRLDTFSRVTTKSDTTGAVEFTAAPHAAVELVVGVELVAVELVVALEEEEEEEEVESKRRGFMCKGGAGSAGAPKALERRLEVEGQVEAVFPGSTADTDWLTESEVRRPLTRTSAKTSPCEPRTEVMSQRRPW